MRHRRCNLAEEAAFRAAGTAPAFALSVRVGILPGEAHPLVIYSEERT